MIGDFIVGIGLLLLGGCVTMLGFAIKRHLEEGDERANKIEGHAMLLTQLQGAVEHVQKDQRAHAEHAKQLSDVRVTVGKLDERSQIQERYMRSIARQGAHTQALVVRLLERESTARPAAAAAPATH
jgi:hypothetical protein